jgi:superoxide reductase
VDVKEHPLFKGYNEPKDPANLTELEKKHIPTIEIPDRIVAGKPFSVKATVGEIQHPTTEDHHIGWIEFFANGHYLARVDLLPAGTRPEASITCVFDDPGENSIWVQAYCTLHGLWYSLKKFSVSGS